MIFGSVRVIGPAVETHRVTYQVSCLSAVSVKRPLLPGGILFAIGGGAFVRSFSDLLYAHEIAIIVSAITVALLIGWYLGQIQLLSRDLRGSDLSCMIWGTYGHLGRVRREIARAMGEAPTGDPLGRTPR